MLPRKTLIGIENLGSSCYINVCIQILFYTDEMNSILLEEYSNLNEDSAAANTDLLREWLEICNEMSKPYTKPRINISPKRFIHYIQKTALEKNRPEFGSPDLQNDFAEFLYFIMDCFHSGISRPVQIQIKGKGKTRQDELAQTCFEYLKQLYKKEYSKILSKFYGLTVSEIISTTPCKKVLSTTPEHFFMLELEIFEGASSLYDCIDRYVSDEILTGENAWYNEKSGCKETVSKKISFWHFPDIFIICLKRFQRGVKNNALVRFPLTGLDLSPYVCGYEAAKFSHYNLYATCNHYGNLSYGHYTANILNGEEWICFNDGNVGKISNEEDVMKNAYCLFYRIRETKVSP